MSTIVTDALMNSASTPHVAHRQGDGTWRVSWLPDRTLTRDQGLAAINLAEVIVRAWCAVDPTAQVVVRSLAAYGFRHVVAVRPMGGGGRRRRTSS